MSIHVRPQEATQPSFALHCCMCDDPAFSPKLPPALLCSHGEERGEEYLWRIHDLTWEWTEDWPAGVGMRGAQM